MNKMYQTNETKKFETESSKKRKTMKNLYLKV